MSDNQNAETFDNQTNQTKMVKYTPTTSQDTSNSYITAICIGEIEGGIIFPPVTNE